MKPVSIGNLTLRVVAGLPCLYRTLPDQRWLCAFERFGGGGRLLIGRAPDGLAADKEWDFPTPEGAVAALATWNGEAEPPGWASHRYSARRRFAPLAIVDDRALATDSGPAEQGE